MFARSKKRSTNIALRGKGEGEQAVMFLIAALGVAITHYRNANLPSLWDWWALCNSQWQMSSSQVLGELVLGSEDTSAHTQVKQLKQRKKNKSYRPLAKYSRRSSSLPWCPLSGAGPDPLDVHIPRICFSTMTRGHNPGQGAKEAAFAFWSFFSPSRSSRVLSSLSCSGSKCWDHADDGNISQVLHGVYWWKAQWTMTHGLN